MRDQQSSGIGRTLTAIALAMVTSAAAAQAGAQTPTASGSAARSFEKFIEIDGAKDPDAIPAYLAWEHAFRVLKKNRLGLRSPTLHLSPEDDALLEIEVEGQQRRDSECEKRQYARLDALKEARTDQEQVPHELYAVAIECRQETLDASERLMSKMTPEGWAELERWVLEARKGVTAVVDPQFLKHFRLPR